MEAPPNPRDFQGPLEAAPPVRGALSPQAPLAPRPAPRPTAASSLMNEKHVSRHDYPRLCPSLRKRPPDQRPRIRLSGPQRFREEALGEAPPRLKSTCQDPYSPTSSTRIANRGRPRLPHLGRVRVNTRGQAHRLVWRQGRRSHHLRSPDPAWAFMPTVRWLFKNRPKLRAAQIHRSGRYGAPLAVV